MLRKDSLLAVVGIAILLLSTAAAQANSHRGIVGQQAPELELNNWIDGNGRHMSPVQISQLRGKVIYLYFFQDWCPGCHSRGFPLLKRLYAEFSTSQNVVLLAVQTTFEGYYTNTVEKLRKNQLDYDLPVPMAHDAGTKDKRLPKTMTRYRSGGTPWKVIIDMQGKVVFNGFHIDPDKAVEVIRKLSEK